MKALVCNLLSIIECSESSEVFVSNRSIFFRANYSILDAYISSLFNFLSMAFTKNPTWTRWSASFKFSRFYPSFILTRMESDWKFLAQVRTLSARFSKTCNSHIAILFASLLGSVDMHLSGLLSVIRYTWLRYCPRDTSVKWSPF